MSGSSTIYSATSLSSMSGSSTISKSQSFSISSILLDIPSDSNSSSGKEISSNSSSSFATSFKPSLIKTCLISDFVIATVGAVENKSLNFVVLLLMFNLSILFKLFLTV